MAAIGGMSGGVGAIGGGVGAIGAAGASIGAAPAASALPSPTAIQTGAASVVKLSNAGMEMAARDSTADGLALTIHAAGAAGTDRLYGPSSVFSQHTPVEPAHSIDKGQSLALAQIDHLIDSHMHLADLQQFSELLMWALLILLLKSQSQSDNS